MSIQISKTSWHYRLVSFMNSDYVVNRGLCAYMRKVMFSMLWLVVFAAIIGLLTFLLIGSPVIYWLAKFGVMEMTKHRQVIGLVAQGMWVFAGCGFGFVWLRGRIKERNYGKPEKAPSVFVEYIKAKKQKFCPNIEFV